MNKRLFVAGIPYSVTEENLQALFSEFGAVVSVKIIMDRETGKSKGFGFVEMENPEAAAAATQKLNGSDFEGRKLVVAEAKPMEERPRTFGGDRKPFGRREGGRGSFGRDGRQRGFKRGGRR